MLTSTKQLKQNVQKNEVPINSINPASYTVKQKTPEVEFLNKKKRNRKKSNESFDKLNSSTFNENSSISQSENTDKRTIFKTFKASRNSDSQNEMKKMMRLMKNRLSARKCRQKKKYYVEQMEEEILQLKNELEKYKNMEKKEKSLEGMIKAVRI
jgi:hypothetical protein